MFIGVFLFSLLPSPKFPSSFAPHTYSFPSVVIATLLSKPAEIDLNVLSLIIILGVVTLLLVPFPSCPLLFSPHVYNFPNSSIAK